MALVPTAVDYNYFEYLSQNPVEVTCLQLLFDFIICPDPAVSDLEPETVQAAFLQLLALFADDHGFPLFELDECQICKLDCIQL